MPAPTVEDNPVLCKQCGRQYSSYMYRVVNAGEEQAVSLIDRDNCVVYDLVIVCFSCSTVFYWHTKEKTLQENSKVYQTAFEQLMSYYANRESAIIKETNSTG